MRFKALLILVVGIGLPTLVLSGIFEGKTGTHIGQKTTDNIGFWGATPGPRITAGIIPNATPLPTDTPAPAIAVQVNALSHALAVLEQALITRGIVGAATPTPTPTATATATATSTPSATATPLG